MDKAQYTELLKDPRWQKRRLQILERDEWKCQNCFDTDSTLVVHHRLYLPHTEPWGYPDRLLVTLCEKCHISEKDDRPNVESILLKSLQSHFLLNDLMVLTSGFRSMELQNYSNVVAGAYQWALLYPKMQKEIISKYFVSIKKAGIDPDYIHRRTHYAVPFLPGEKECTKRDI